MLILKCNAFQSQVKNALSPTQNPAVRLVVGLELLRAGIEAGQPLGTAQGGQGQLFGGSGACGHDSYWLVAPFTNMV